MENINTWYTIKCLILFILIISLSAFISPKIILGLLVIWVFIKIMLK